MVFFPQDRAEHRTHSRTARTASRLCSSALCRCRRGRVRSCTDDRRQRIAPTRSAGIARASLLLSAPGGTREENCDRPSSDPPSLFPEVVIQYFLNFFEVVVFRD